MKQIYVDHPRIEHGAAQLAVHKKTFDEVLAQLESDLAPPGRHVERRRARPLRRQEAGLARGGAGPDHAARQIAKLTSDAHVGYVDTVSRVKDAWT